MDKRNYSVGILAGGKSSRMGENKALIEYSSKTFLRHLTDEFSGWGQIILSQNPREVLEAGEDVISVFDEHEDIGPIEGIRRILTVAECEYVFICAVDMPLLKSELAEYLTEFISSDYDCYVVKDEKHFHPLCAIYSKAVLPVIEQLIAEGKYKLMELLDRVRTKYISLEKTCISTKQLSNYNTCEDLKKLYLPAVFAVSGTKDSGKTYLIIKLINEFIKEGFTVGVIKHDGHDYLMDHEGSDTDRFYKEGAVFTAIYNKDKFSINAAKPIDHEKLISMCPEADIIICEGFKDTSLPKVVVKRCETFEPYDFADPVIARVSDSQSGLSFEDTSLICSRIKKYFNIVD